MKTSWASVLFLAIALLAPSARIAQAVDVDANAAASLRARYDGLQNRLSHNQFQRPLYLDSSETPASVTGDIYARIDYPFEPWGNACKQQHEGIFPHQGADGRRLAGEQQIERLALRGVPCRLLVSRTRLLQLCVR